MARVGLRIDGRELARRASVSPTTVAHFESEQRQPRQVTIDALRSALEAAGATFLDDEGEGPGVRIKGDALEA